MKPIPFYSQSGLNIYRRGRSTWICCFFYTMVVLSMSFARVGTIHAQTKPNIIFILVDDLGIDGVGCYGSDKRKTPQLDRLATSGTRFDICYSMPMCAPSRMTLMSGRYPFRTGSLLKVGQEQPIAKLLKEGGYATAQAGKWRQMGGRPSEWGFEEYCTDDTAGGYYWKDSYIKNGETIKVDKETYNPDVLQKFCLDFIQRHQEKPFFLYYAMHLVHTPILRTPDSKGDVKGDAVYDDNIAYMDKQIGEVVGFLEKLKLTSKTVVLVAGDNGSNHGFQTTIGGRQINGAKLSILEGGSRVPFIASWTGTTPASKVSKDIISFADFHTTFLELAGVKPPEGLTFDGISFAPQLHGEVGDPRKWAFVQFGPKWFVREKGWKMNNSGELFEMSDAPFVEKLVPLENDTEVTREARKRLTKILGTIDPASGNISGGEEEQKQRQAQKGAERSSNK